MEKADSLQTLGASAERELPEFVLDRYGNRVDTRGDIWHVNDPSIDLWHSTMDFTMLHDGTLRDALKHWIVYSIKAHSPRETLNQFEEIRWILQKNPNCPESLADLDLKWFQRTRQILRENHAEYRLHRVRAWYLWMSDHEFDEVDDDTAITIESWSIPGNIKGEAVRQHDTSRGPLTYREFAHLTTYLRDLVAKGKRSQEIAAIMLCTDLGPNPKQLSLLEARDLHVFTDSASGEKSYMLDVPRIKKRLSGRETKRRVISNESGILLAHLIAAAPERVRLLGAKAPIFWADKKRHFPPGSKFRGRFDWHTTSDEFRRMMAAFCENHRLCAPGATERYTISPRRLRYTFGTRLAAQGVPPAMIAELLDHTDLQHVGVYVQSTELLSDRLDAKIGEQLMPYARRAFGFVDGPKGSRLGVSQSSIAHPTKPLGIGDCGSKSLCHLYPPYSCYGCDYFQPWKDADHASVLTALEEQRSMLAANASDSSDRMPHQLDIVIERTREIVSAQAALQNA
jgi:integrase